MINAGQFTPFRVGFSGTPGTGKSTLSTKLAGAARDCLDVKVVSLVQEYARTYISRHKLPTHLWEQVRILQKQIAEEDRVMNCDLLITDSPYPLGLLYALELRKLEDPKDTIIFNDLLKMMSKYAEGYRYDLVMHLPPILQPVKDGVRTDLQFDPQWRQQADLELKFMFKLFPPRKFVVLNVPLPADMDKLSEQDKRRIIGETRLDAAVKLIKQEMDERKKAGG